ncbi:MAG TPA: hypothetical protein VKR06_30975 [Ktedonosporobacter sp.]|nr:hypothetical protein [Ktedonosporobacter sp.]
MRKSSDPLALDSLMQDVLASARYRDISPDLIRRIAEQELAKRRNLKEALKTTKSKLHQVGGAYFAGQEQQYAAWLAELQAVVQTEDKQRIQQVCRRLMEHHTSTGERLPILDQFYSTILADLAPIHSLLDIACGLNPLAIPWMPLAQGAHYYGYDIYQQMTAFLNEWLAIMKVQGHVQARDVIQSCPGAALKDDLPARGYPSGTPAGHPLWTDEVEVAFILKTIPCLEQVDKQAGHRLLHSIRARHLVVSFPVHSLGGHSKGMAANYEARFRELLGHTPWTVKKFAFSTELVFVVSK